ncbi:hypothetical protein HRI_000928700 [Hibiscus trionum]|uniref:Uncharacterized protein n=1 Tax=Hibiscus trionum TaxID=183268 RepID=A0A9W7H7V4_HIBTR|nr:hypothetical protein HRI_000928700 [Hibiscus trionum]
MELNLTPTKNLHMLSTFKTPQKSASLIPFKCTQSLAYCSLHRSSRFTSTKFRVHCYSSNSNGFPHGNNVQTNPSKQFLPLRVEFLDPTSLGICPEPSDWPERDVIRRLSIERKANDVGIPHSLRFIKRKRRSKMDSFVDNASEFACSSIKNAISSLVLIIREIQNFTLTIREGLDSTDLMAAMSRIQQDMTLTFVCLFQHVFSKTPTLMVYLMLLLANFSVQSMADKTLSLDATIQQRPANVITETETETMSVSDKESEGEDQRTKVNREVGLWKSMVEEASRMRGELFYKAVGNQIRQQLASPFHVKVEQDNYDVQFMTDLVYQMCVAEEPDNALLLANYAQFLHLVAKDYERAEELYKRAIQADPQDSEALGLYADFLWQVRNDDREAEEIYLQALEVDKKNPFHASKYANFLWSTGGEGTCLVFDASK